MIDKTSPIPMYFQIKEDIISKIESESMKAGDRIEGEFAFMAKYDVSQITIRKALSELVTEGYLYRIRGKGTYVANKRQKHTTSPSSFTEEMIESGHSSDIQIIEVGEVQSERISKIMGLSAAEKMVKIKRVRISDSIPVGLQTSYIPSAQIALGAFDELSELKSVYKILERYGKRPVRVKECYRAVVIENSTTQALLKTSLGAPAFFVTRHGYNQLDELLEYTESILLGSKYELVTETYHNR